MYTTVELTERVGGVLDGAPDLEVAGVESIEQAAANEITFISDGPHARRWPEVRAGAAVVVAGLDVEPFDRERRAVIRVPDADVALITLLELFAPPAESPAEGVHPSAVIAGDARLGRGVRIGPHVSVGPAASIGDGVVLHDGARIAARVTIGAGSVIHANCVIRDRCELGRRVILHPGVSIGADGFGFRPDPSGAGLVKVPHIGTVIIEDGVEVGANSCVDRGKFGPTRIGAGTKIDNLVQIGHNCQIGRCTVIAGLTALAGSVTIGDGCQIGGGSGIAEHRRIGHGVRLGGGSGVTKDIPDGETWLGYPAAPASQTLRQWAVGPKLPDWFRDVSCRLDRSDSPGAAPHSHPAGPPK